MPRPLRIEFPDACYHVMCRGNARLPIFRADADKELLLDRMIHFADIFRVEIRAYCVMPNHIHIHLRTREANLGAYMRSFLTSFTTIYNHRHDSCGHVLQGRYKAFLVEDARPYVAKVTGYIHLNPVRVAALDDTPSAVCHELAVQCQWSSYGQILGVRTCPSWLSTEAVLKGWGVTLEDQRKAYRAAVLSRLQADIVDPQEEATARAILGSEGFVERIKRGLNDLAENLNVRRESTQQRQLASWDAIDDVVDAVAATFGCAKGDLKRRGNRGCEARQVLLYLAAVRCRGRYTLSTIAEELGPLTLSGLDSARAKMATRLREDKELNARVSNVLRILEGKHVKSKPED